MMKVLSGRELAGFIKERQARQVAALSKKPTLLIIRDNDSPVIQKYVQLKIKYGEDIGVNVIEYFSKDLTEIEQKIQSANSDPAINGIIIQLPLANKVETERLCNLIEPSKDVDGLGKDAKFDSATATAILWLLTGYDIDLDRQKIAIVGRGKLVGAPLYKMFTDSNFDVSLFHHGDDLTKLKQYDIIITATGVPGLIVDSMIKPGATVIDAGTASENGILKGDVSESVRLRKDLTAITPKLGGVGPLTVACLFDHVIQTTN